jgi:hypothetical protein
MSVFERERRREAKTIAEQQVEMKSHGMERDFITG